MPSNAPAIKRAATLALGAEVVDVGPASNDRLAKAEELVRVHGYVVIPPYDDEQIIAGQATCGLEIVEALPDVDLVQRPIRVVDLGQHRRLSGVGSRAHVANSF
jgi:threonine dehydratase